MRAAIYARVSTLDQEPENQLAELRRYAADRGWTAVADVFLDPAVLAATGLNYQSAAADGRMWPTGEQILRRVLGRAAGDSSTLPAKPDGLALNVTACLDPPPQCFRNDSEGFD